MLLTEFQSGIVGNSLGIIATYPLDVLKSNRQVYPNTPLKELVKQLTKRQIGLYRGMSTSLLTYPMYWGMYFSFTSSFHPKSLTGVHYFLCGCLSSLIVNPFFICKTRIQVDPSKYFTSVIGEIYKENGLRGFLAGYPLTLLSNVKLGIQFPLYGLLMANEQGPVVAGMVSKSIANIALYPFDSIRTRQRNGEQGNFVSIMKNVYRQEGIRGFYKGAHVYNLISCTQFTIMMCYKEYMSRE